MATIASIVLQPAGQARQHERFQRVARSRATLIAGYGIEGDAKAGHHPLRQINLLSQAWLAARAREGYRTQPGDFGEQLVIEGLAVEELAPGDRLRLGETARIEITQPRSGCPKLARVQGIESGVRPGPVGMLARVVQSGQIYVGDPVVLLAQTVRSGP